MARPLLAASLQDRLCSGRMWLSCWSSQLLPAAASVPVVAVMPQSAIILLWRRRHCGNARLGQAGAGRGSKSCCKETASLPTRA